MIILFEIRARQKSLQIKTIQPVNKINLSSLGLITNCVIVLVRCFFPVCISLTMPFRKMILSDRPVWQVVAYFSITSSFSLKICQVIALYVAININLVTTFKLSQIERQRF